MPEEPLQPNAGANPGDAELAHEKRQTDLLNQIKRLLSDRKKVEEEDDEENWTSNILTGLLILGLLIGAFFLIRPIFDKKPVDPAYAKVEGIKRMKELTLVRHHYETIIPIRKKAKNEEDRDLQVLLMAPCQVNGFIDLRDMRFDVLEDSLIQVTLPQAEINEPWIGITQTKEYTFRKNIWKRMGEKMNRKAFNYLAAYDQIRMAIDSTRREVARKAIMNGILEDTEEKAEDYIRNMVNNFGYRVEFIQPEEPTFALPDSLGIDQYYQQIMQEANPRKRRQLESRFLRNVSRISRLVN